MQLLKKIVLRADGNRIIGHGHVYRLLALAEILREDFECCFAISSPLESIKIEIQRLNIQLIELPFFEYKLPNQRLPNEEINFDLQPFLNGNEIVVIDGYWFGLNYQSQIKNIGSRLVCIDDFCNINTCADAIINHAPNIDLSTLPSHFNSIFYSGLDYAILRNVFYRPIEPNKSNNCKAFVSLGGSDYFGYSIILTQYILQLNYFQEVNVLCSHSFTDETIQQLNRLSTNNTKVNVQFNLSAPQIVDLLDQCTHAFVSASTVLFEAYARGLYCFAGYYTENQRLIYNGYTNLNLAAGLGIFSALDFQTFANAFNNQSKLLILQKELNSKDNIKKLFSQL